MAPLLAPKVCNNDQIDLCLHFSGQDLTDGHMVDGRVRHIWSGLVGR